MKKYFIIDVLITLMALAIIFVKYNNFSENKIVLGQEFTLKINQKANFENKLNIQLKDMSDSRCPPDVMCVWQGEIAVTLKINNVKYDLGSVLKKEVNIKDTIYAIEYLPEYNTKTATFKIYISN